MYYLDLCELFISISYGVWRWMRRARLVRNPMHGRHARLHGMRLRETTLTDYIVLRLLESRTTRVIVSTVPPHLEAKQGADLEIWFTHNREQGFGLRAQCKILGPNDEFEHLYYSSGNQQTPQHQLLINSVSNQKNIIPVYLLYSYLYNKKPKYICSYAFYRKYCYHRTGAWFMSAYKVKDLYAAKQKHKSIQQLLKYMIPWNCIVCNSPSMLYGQQFIENIIENTINLGLSDGDRKLIGNLPSYVIRMFSDDTVESFDEYPSRHIVIIQV